MYFDDQIKGIKLHSNRTDHAAQTLSQRTHCVDCRIKTQLLHLRLLELHCNFSPYSLVGLALICLVFLAFIIQRNSKTT